MFNFDIVHNPAQHIYYSYVKLNIHMGSNKKTSQIKCLHINKNENFMNTEVTIAAYNGDIKWCMNKSVLHHNMFIRQSIQQNR